MKHPDDPRFIALGERMEKLREEHEAGLLTSMEFLKALLALAKDVAQVEKETVPEEEVDKGKAALTELFQNVRNDNTPVIVERIVNDIDGINWQKITFISDTSVTSFTVDGATAALDSDTMILTYTNSTAGFNFGNGVSVDKANSEAIIVDGYKIDETSGQAYLDVRVKGVPFMGTSAKLGTGGYMWAPMSINYSTANLGTGKMLLGNKGGFGTGLGSYSLGTTLTFASDAGKSTTLFTNVKGLGTNAWDTANNIYFTKFVFMGTNATRTYWGGMTFGLGTGDDDADNALAVARQQEQQLYRDDRHLQHRRQSPHKSRHGSRCEHLLRR